MTSIASSLPATATITVKTTGAAGVALGLWTPATQTVMEATPNKNRRGARRHVEGRRSPSRYKNTRCGDGRSTSRSRSRRARRDATYSIAVTAR